MKANRYIVVSAKGRADLAGNASLALRAQTGWGHPAYVSYWKALACCGIIGQITLKGD